MPNTFTLEEAALKLGMTPDQFKVNLKTHKDFRNIRPLMGGSTMHFRAQDIEELVRKLGLGSDLEFPGTASSEPSIPLAIEEDVDDEQVEIGREPSRGSGLSSSRLQSGSSKRLRPPTPPAGEEPLVEDTSDEFIPIVADKGKRDSSAKVTPSSSGKRKRVDTGTPTEEIDLSAEAKKSGSRDVFSLADDEKKTPKPSGKKLTDSDSDFELTLADDSSDEVELGSLPPDVTGKSGKSGVKLKAPSDSGISLEAQDDSSSEFELNLDSASSTRISGPKSSKKQKAEDSDSEFELTLDDSSSQIAPALESGGEQKDIFETDFDIPALDDESASEAVVLEETDTDLESSDFDLAVDQVGEESASEVVELDEEGVVEAVDDAEGPSADEELAGVEDEEVRPAYAGAPAPAKWGALPAVVLGLTMPFLLLTTLMAYELVKGAWGYRQPNKATSPIASAVAGLFFDDLPKDRE